MCYVGVSRQQRRNRRRRRMGSFALRIAGWDYGNEIWLPDGTKIQKVLTIFADDNEGIVHVILPKTIELSNGTTLNIRSPTSEREYVVIVGSQDGYGIDYWRPVALKQNNGNVVAQIPRLLLLTWLSV